MGTHKVMKTLDEEFEYKDDEEEVPHMNTPVSSDDETMQHRNLAITLIQQQSENMKLDAIVGYRALQFYDKYASSTTVQEEDLERVATSCFTISLRTMDHQKFTDMLMSHRNLITKEIQRSEDRIARRCDWELRGPNSFTFLDYFVDKFCVDETFKIPVQEIQKLILKFQKEKKCPRFKPSVITAAAILKITSKLGKEEFLIHKCCTRNIFSEQGFMNEDEVETQVDIIDCESAMEKWYLMMVEKGEISLEIWLKDLYEPIEGSTKEGEVSGDDSSSQVIKHQTSETQEESQASPSSTDKGKGKESEEELTKKFLQEIHTSEIQEEPEAGPSSADKGKGKATEEELTTRYLDEMLRRGELSLPRVMELMLPHMQSPDKRVRRAVEIREEGEASPSSSERTAEDYVGAVLEKLRTGGDSTEAKEAETESAAKQALPLEKTGQRLVGVELNWGGEETPDDSEGEGGCSTRGKRKWNRVAVWVAKNSKKLKKKLKRGKKE